MPVLGILDGWVDLAAALTVGLFFLYGVIRGLTIQLVGLVVLLGALVAADAATPVVGRWIRDHVWEQVDPGVSSGIAFALVALSALLLASLLFHLTIGRFPAKARLPLDRLLGGVLGAIKGSLIVLAVLLLLVNALWEEDARPPQGGLLGDLLASGATDGARRVCRGLARILPDGAGSRIREYAKPLGDAAPSDY